MKRQLINLIPGLLMLAGCGKEPPPRSVNEFVANPLLLEAAMVRCAEDRSKTRYDTECVNARLAVSRIQAREEDARRAELEASSVKKRDALRRTQAAAAEARRRAAEAERLREEAEYLAQFGVVPPDDAQDAEQGNGAATEVEAIPQADGAEVQVVEPAVNPAVTDLESVREELRRRNAEDGD